MPGKFVTRAAERAGVSIETAELRWKEAKEKVHKGKRRGSWYWGKVMNTFKRMMGLMEAVTLKEWIELEQDELELMEERPVPFRHTVAHLLKTFYIGRGITAEFYHLSANKATFHLKQLMEDEPVGFLYMFRRAHKLYVATHLMDGKMIAVKQIWIPAFDEDVVKEFVLANPPPLVESDQGQNKNDQAERAMIHRFVDLANSRKLMSGGKSEENLAMAYDFLESPWGGMVWDKYYELFTSMHPEFKGPFDARRYSKFKQDAFQAMTHWKNGDEFKGPTLDPMHEGRVQHDRWPEVTIEAPTGWGVQFADLWHLLDEVFGSERNWLIPDDSQFRSRWKSGEPITFKYRPDIKIDYKKLRDAGFSIIFLPD